MGLVMFVSHAQDVSQDPYENLFIRKISISIENAKEDKTEESILLHKMHTKMGTTFNQENFDLDLKKLSEEYEEVLPEICIDGQQMEITLLLKKHPIIDSISFAGSSYSDKKLLKESGLKKDASYSASSIYNGMYKIQEFLLKKGFFKAKVNYVLEKDEQEPGHVHLHVSINEGFNGHIHKIAFQGFSAQEEGEIKKIIRTKTYSLSSWMTKLGLFNQEIVDADVIEIVRLIQDRGYPDAFVTANVEENAEKGSVSILFILERGSRYFFKDIYFHGSTLKSEEELKSMSRAKADAPFSIKSLQETQEEILSFYSKNGYPYTSINYQLNLSLENPQKYDVSFYIEESKKCRIGLVKCTGNQFTKNNVLYNRLNVAPGEVLNTKKLKESQEKLSSTKFLKDVNVYPIKSEKARFGSNEEIYDVFVDVNESTSASIGLFFGGNSTDTAFAGLELTETNFNLWGIKDFAEKGISAFRGGGQYFQLKGTLGVAERSFNATWMDPYLNDSLYRLGCSFDYSINHIYSKKYRIDNLGGNVFVAYPPSQCSSIGCKVRAKDSIFVVTSKDATPMEKEERKNNGVVSGIASTLSYDNTDNTFRAYSGLRHNSECEFVGLWRKEEGIRDFPYLKFLFLNTHYFPFRNLTIKTRLDLKCIQLLSKEDHSSDLPSSERFFLGGLNSLRGYAQGRASPLYPGTSDPKGGISSVLTSVEFLKNIAPPLDVFFFVDVGGVSENPWKIGTDNIKGTFGFGARIDTGRFLPFIVGLGFPIRKKENPALLQKFFFSISGQF